jgi:hypothetical protein
MNRILILAIGAVLVAAAAILLPGAAEKALGQGHGHRHGDSGQKADQPSRPGMMGGMEGMKMSEPMKMRCRMMMNMEVTSHDPAALLALKDQIKLTEEQTDRLQAILTQARQQAGQVLTHEQTAQLQPLEKLPKTMAQMHHQMMEKMGHAKGGMKMQMMCPMMEMMEHMDHEHSAAKGGAAEHGHKH